MYDTETEIAYKCYKVETVFVEFVLIAQQVEAMDLKSIQCQFESDWGYAPVV